MRILLVEDDEFKQIKVASVLRGRNIELKIILADSLYSAISALDDIPFDLIVLDMAIPSHPPVQGEGAPISFLTGGLDVLLELGVRGRSDPCIVLTQFPEIEISGVFYSVDASKKAIKNLLDYDVITCLAYSADNDGWIEKFKEIVDNHENSSS